MPGLILRYELLAENLEISGEPGYFPAFEGYYDLGAQTLGRVFSSEGPEGQSTVMSLADTDLGINLRNFGSPKVNKLHIPNTKRDEITPPRDRLVNNTEERSLAAAVIRR